MRRFLFVPIVCAAIAVPALARAQQPPAAGEDESRSLFELAPNQFIFGGRVSSVDGDPARWQRYQDLRDGVLFTAARFTRADPNGFWNFHATADNVGYRDQRYSGIYDRAGKFVISGLWDEIPQFYSVDTKTPYTTNVSPLLLPDATQRAIQNGDPAKLNLSVPIAPQFDLRERRDIGNVNLRATATPHLDVTAAFTTTKHSGELPWGASFGFSNDVEVALPYDSRTNDFTLGAEWNNNRSMVRVAYDGSWFENQSDPLVWDSPLRLDDDIEEGPGRGRMSLWPTNAANTVSAAGSTKLARRTQLTGSLSFGVFSNDETLQPFTINSALPQLELPRATADARAHMLTTAVNLVSRPIP